MRSEADNARSGKQTARDRLLLELGRGGMGTVYLAVSRGPAGFSKLKVVKRLRPELASDEQFLQMFLEEARIAARLNHPNVVQTFEVGFDGVNYFIEMEYLEGQSLDAIQRRARRSGGMPLSLSLWTLHQALAGLHYAHELRDAQGDPLRLVHRDISPHNLLVTYDGAVKVLDFGIAKAADSVAETRTGVIKGKTTYMAPEQAERAPVDRRADIFAMGVILWQALTGERLWGELGDTEILARLRRGEVRTPRSVKPDVPEQLEAICVKALMHDAQDRFSSAEEFQVALGEYLENTGARVGDKQLGKFVATLFEERRAAVRAEIDAQMREQATTTDRGIDVAVLAEQATVREMASGEVLTSPTNPAGLAAQQTRREGSGTSARRARGAQTGWWLAAGAVVILGGGAAIVTSVARVPGSPLPHEALPPTSGAVPPLPIAPRAGECVKNSECLTGHAGHAFICRKDTHVCVALENEDCRVLAEPGDVENEDTLWIGAMFPTSGDFAESLGKPALHATDLARQDFARIAHGIPSPTASARARPIALLTCDDAGHTQRVARHLAVDVGVVAVIGFDSPRDFVEVAPSLFVPNEVLSVAALNMSSLITNISQPAGSPRMVWRSNTSYASFAAPIGAVISGVFETDWAASPASRRGEKPLRVAVLRPSSGSGMGYTDSLMRAIRLNGKSAAENGANYQEFTYGNPYKEGVEARYAALVAPLLEYLPNVIVWPGDSEALVALLEPLELRWPAKLSYRPKYVSNSLFFAKEFGTFFREVPERQHRFVAVNAPASTPANLSFTVRYNEDYTPKVTAWEAPGASYDAFYLVAYGIFATNKDRPSGADVSRAIPRLMQGPLLDVGPSRLLEAFSLLRAGGGIDLNGTVTKLDFDVQTGEPATDFAIYCPKLEERTGAVASVESGLTYDPARGQLKGTMRCP